MTVAPMVVSAATHGVNGVGIDYTTDRCIDLTAGVFTDNIDNHMESYKIIEKT